jgi:hypothetical protein
VNFSKLILLGWSVLLLLTASSLAQTPGTVTLPVHSAAVDASSENSRLRQMESIYQQQLRTRHIPLLGKYLTTLQRLAATTTTATDAKPYQQEIERIQSIISGGGVVDLSAAVQSLRIPAEMPVPTPMPMPRRGPRTPISLTPALARSISPLPVGSASPEAAAIGEIEWRIESLGAGTHELVMQYACPNITTPLKGEVEFAGQKIAVTLDAAKATAKATTYRILRLGQITLSTEAKGEILHLRFGAKESNTLLIRQMVIARAKPPL